MTLDTTLYDLLDSLCDDTRIGPAHISLYLAILQCYRNQGYQMPIIVNGRELRKRAKIAGSGTYHKYMQDLKSYGYIGYVSSFNPVLGSLVYLLKNKL